MTLRGKGVIKLCSERIHVNITQTVKSDGLHYEEERGGGGVTC